MPAAFLGGITGLLPNACGMTPAECSVQVSAAPKVSAAPGSTTVETASAPARRNIRAVRMGSKRLKADGCSDFGAAWQIVLA
jgi:hypothetical protein